MRSTEGGGEKEPVISTCLKDSCPRTGAEKGTTITETASKVAWLIVASNAAGVLGALRQQLCEGVLPWC